tara:strand:+ start:860 stop:1747 length:888 start_codon:yes stop_codon:yes gene_type:complete
MATLILRWDHPEYAKCRDDPRFLGFEEEYATPLLNPVNSARGHTTDVNANTTQVKQDGERCLRPVVVGDIATDNTFHNNDTILRGDFYYPRDDVAPTSSTFLASNRYLNVLDGTTTRLQTFNAVQGLMGLKNQSYTFAKETLFPSHQLQTIPDGARGSLVRLIKIDVQFTKAWHNFESITLDFSRVVEGEQGLYSSNQTRTPSSITVYSDGHSKVESHGFGTVIGVVRDSRLELGITEFKYQPRLGMSWAGISTGNDVALSASGIESVLSHDFNHSIRGHTNGHLLSVSAVLELV